MKPVISTATFMARHFLVVPILIVMGCVAWTLVYALLFLAAIFLDSGVGGPLAFPAGLLAIVVVSISLGWGVFTPASAAGAVFCALLKLPRFAAIPVVTVVAFLLSYLFYWGFIKLVTTHPMPDATSVLKNFAIYLSIPLGVYWWATEGPGAVIDVIHRWLQSRRQHTAQRPR